MSALAKLLMLPGVTSPFSFLMQDRATIFMLHRFEDPELGVEGQRPAAIRQGLSYLRRHRYNLVSLEDVFRQGIEGRLDPKTVAFTIDDGYLDHARVGASVFAEFDCPATTFLITGFVDGDIWLWWDQIEFVFRHVKRLEIAVPLASQLLQYKTFGGHRRQAQADFTARCKKVSDPDRAAAIMALSAAAEVAIPRNPPPQYAPLSWDHARACERRGMTFGPHTVTHPILSRSSDEQAEREIRLSWDRLQAEVARPVPVFCYPSGGREDFGAREIRILTELGFRGAVAGLPGYLHGQALRQPDSNRYRVRRLGFPDDLQRLIQYAAGMERFKASVRREQV